MVEIDGRRSIRDEASCRVAAESLSGGLPIGTYVRGVCAIWVDGDNESAIETAYKIKKRGRRPFGVILSATSLGEMIDVDRISPETRSLFLNPKLLSARLGSLCFIRYPIRESIALSLPDAVLSRDGEGTPWLQSWLPEGCLTTRIWMQQLHKRRIDLPIVSSMNVSGQPELVDQDEGAVFCDRHGILYFLGDPESVEVAKGSFPIVQVDETGISVIREGHFPSFLFDHLLDGWKTDRDNLQPARYPVIETHSQQSASAIAPDELRRQMIDVLDGAPDKP